MCVTRACRHRYNYGKWDSQWLGGISRGEVSPEAWGHRLQNSLSNHVTVPVLTYPPWHLIVASSLAAPSPTPGYLMRGWWHFSLKEIVTSLEAWEDKETCINQIPKVPLGFQGNGSLPPLSPNISANLSTRTCYYFLPSFFF